MPCDSFAHCPIVDHLHITLFLTDPLNWTQLKVIHNRSKIGQIRCEIAWFWRKSAVSSCEGFAMESLLQWVQWKEGHLEPSLKALSIRKGSFPVRIMHCPHTAAVRLVLFLLPFQTKLQMDIILGRVLWLNQHWRRANANNKKLPRILSTGPNFMDMCSGSRSLLKWATDAGLPLPAPHWTKNNTSNLLLGRGDGQVDRGLRCR
jgi:hypothetical protein